MPPSKRVSVDSEHSFDLLGPMNYNPNPAYPGKPSGALSSSLPSKQADAWKRASLPVSDTYANLLGRIDFDDVRTRRAGDRSSMNGYYDHASRQRAQFHEEQFKYKDTTSGGARERVQRDSPVIAELRTNVIIKDEFTLVTDLSYHLSSRYTRPDSSIMVKVDHSVCLALGGTFDPCYILSITTVPSQMGPIMNKRNAALIQSFMTDILSVPPDRGIVKFEIIAEENLAINGSTLLGEIERQEKQQNGDGPAARRAMTNASRKSVGSFNKNAPRTEDKVRGNDQPESGSLARAKSTNGTSADVSSPTGIFELPGEVDRKRPSTVHSHSGSDGLRMNGISSQELSPSLPEKKQERPKSMIVDGPSVQDQLKQLKDKPLPQQPAAHQRPQARRTNSASSTKKERPPSFLKHDPTKPTAAGARQQPTTPEAKSKPRDSYLDGYLGTSLSTKDLEPTITENSAAERLAEKKDTAANTAKRRSTITATPKMPAPPPIPADTPSVKGMKVGKRKSFLAAFRRSTAAQ